MIDTITVEIDEGDRQLILMALAHLAVERPGYADYVESIALSLSEFNPSPEDGKYSYALTMYEELKRHRAEAIAKRGRELAPQLLAALKNIRAVNYAVAGPDDWASLFAELDGAIERAERGLQPATVKPEGPPIHMAELLIMRRHPTPAMLTVVEQTITQYVVATMQTQGFTIPMAGPILGALSAIADHPQSHTRISKRLRIYFARFVMMNIGGLKRRPGFNDYLIARWAILGKEHDATRLIENAMRDDTIGETARWALASLCHEHGDFRTRFEGPLAMIRSARRTKDEPGATYQPPPE